MNDSLIVKKTIFKPSSRKIYTYVLYYKIYYIFMRENLLCISIVLTNYGAHTLGIQSFHSFVCKLNLFIFYSYKNNNKLFKSYYEN